MRKSYRKGIRRLNKLGTVGFWVFVILTLKAFLSTNVFTVVSVIAMFTVILTAKGQLKNFKKFLRKIY